MTPEMLQILTQYGGLGILALFAWILLKSVLKQQERLTSIIDNHLTQLVKRQEAETKLIEQLLTAFGQHEDKAVKRYESLYDSLRDALKTEGKK